MESHIPGVEVVLLERYGELSFEFCVCLPGAKPHWASLVGCKS